jgi:cytochrome c biogenesis protein CcmG/thiol:disulfide interchange protein DsbE
MLNQPGSTRLPASALWRALAPLGIFAALASVLFIGLSLDPKTLPSALLDKPLPSFDLEPLDADQPRLRTADFADGQVSVINVFASWCAPCRVEMPILGQLAADGDVRLVGLIYKDKTALSRRFLAEYGNPFSRIGLDPLGRAGIDFGVYGVPVTYVVNGQGIIVFKHVGPLTAELVATKLRPAIAAARLAPAPKAASVG